jgi:hypothetical protein
MTIVRRAAGASANGTTSVVLARPAGTVNGDVLLAFVIDHATSGSSTAPTGWTNQGGAAVAAGRFQVFSAVVGMNGLTGASWSFTGLTGPAVGIIVGYINVDNTTPLDVAVSAQQNASGTTGTTSITPISANAMIVAAFASMSNGSTWSAEATATSPGSLSEISDNANSTFCSLATADGLETSATATGASSATMGTAEANAGILVALRPALIVRRQTIGGGFFQAHQNPLIMPNCRFPGDTLAGSLLVCVVEGQSEGTSLLPGTISLATPGISWIQVDVRSCVDSYLSGGTLFHDWAGVAIFYAADAPVLLGTTLTVASLSGIPIENPSAPLISVGLFEFVGIPGASVAATIAAVYNDGHGGRDLSIAPVKQLISAGTLPTSARELVVVGSSAHPSAAGTGYQNGGMGFGGMEYMASAPAGGVDTAFSAASTAAQFACIAIAFSPFVVEVGSCGECPDTHLLELIPGFSDLPDSVLEADDPAFALHVGEIAFNATFGMVRCEVFACPCKHGAIVALPRSCWDGYQYSREELTYIWTVQNSVDPSTNWISGPDSMWFSNWNVNQLTGEVFSEEWYERSSAADSRLAAKSKDGLLMVFTIAQRQKTNLILASPASCPAIDESTIATDKPVTQDLMQKLNQRAKFSCVNSEVFYLGEYTDGQTVTLPVSRADGYSYSAAECKFTHAWRWTAAGANYSQPPGNLEQAAPFQASISSSGVVSISVTFSTNGGEDLITPVGYGRIAAFAFCTRGATPSSGTLANNFTELDLGFFFPGATVRASELLTIKRNIDEAILSPEFFGPADYADGQAVSLPTSSVDGYAYQQSEVQYLWNWSDTTNGTGSHLRLPLFFGSVDPASGVVKLRTYRLPPGGPFMDDNNTLARIKVLVMATRQAIHPELKLGPTDGNKPADAGAFATDNGGNLVNGV